jgi:ribosomal protein L29
MVLPIIQVIGNGLTGYWNMSNEKLREKSPGDLALELDTLKEQLERMSKELEAEIAKNKRLIEACRPGLINQGPGGS